MLIQNLPLRGAALGALGALVMYYVDPSAGRRRRALLRDKVVHWGKASGGLLAKSSRDFNHRAKGALFEARSRFVVEHVPDEILVERVRSKIGRVVSHPHSICVEARNGSVTVSGPVLADQVETLIGCVARVRGVSSVRNNLEAHSTDGGYGAPRAAPRSRQSVSGPRLTGTLVALGLFTVGAVLAFRRRPLAASACAITLAIFASGIGQGALESKAGARRLTGELPPESRPPTQH